MEILNLSGLPFSTTLTSTLDSIPHMHEFYECFYVLEGSIYHQIDGHEILLNVGDAVIVAPYIAHNFKRLPKQICTHRDNLLSQKKFTECCNFIDSELIETLKAKHYIQFKLSKNDIEDFEENVFAYLSSQNIKQRLKYERCLIVALLSRIIISSINVEFFSNDFKSKCIHALNNYFLENDAIKKIYDSLCYNKSYASKKFKDLFGVTLTDKINELKIQYASYLFSVTNYSVSEVCEKIGIESVSYFNKLYKSHYGTTPYKSKNKK